MGGARIVADVTLDELAPDDSAMLILPGADTWLSGDNQAFAKAARRFLEAGTPVAAICGATAGLAMEGLLDHRRHTSNASQFLQAFGYGGVLRIAGGAKRTGTAKDHRGATYEQLARIAYRLGIDKHQRNARKMWYRTARDVMLSEAHADHIIGSLEDPGNP